VWSNDPDCYACGSVATGKATHARKVEGDDRDKRDILFLQVGDWVCG